MNDPQSFLLSPKSLRSFYEFYRSLHSVEWSNDIINQSLASLLLSLDIPFYQVQVCFCCISLMIWIVTVQVNMLEEWHTCVRLSSWSSLVWILWIVSLISGWAASAGFLPPEEVLLPLPFPLISGWLTCWNRSFRVDWRSCSFLVRVWIFSSICTIFSLSACPTRKRNLYSCVGHTSLPVSCWLLLVDHQVDSKLQVDFWSVQSVQVYLSSPIGCFTAPPTGNRKLMILQLYHQFRVKCCKKWPNMLIMYCNGYSYFLSDWPSLVVWGMTLYQTHHKISIT